MHKGPYFKKKKKKNSNANALHGVPRIEQCKECYFEIDRRRENAGLGFSHQNSPYIVVKRGAPMVFKRLRFFLSCFCSPCYVDH